MDLSMMMMMFDVKLKSSGKVSYSLLENRGYRSLNYRNALWYWMGGKTKSIPTRLSINLVGILFVYPPMQ